MSARSIGALRLRRNSRKKRHKRRKKMVGRKSRRAHDYGHVTPLIRAGSEPFRGWWLCVNIRREPAMFHFGETMPRTRPRHGSNPPRSSCVDYLQSYRVRFSPYLFVPLAPFCGYSRFLAILSFFWGLSLSLPYLSAPGLKPWAILYSRFRLRPPPPFSFVGQVAAKFATPTGFNSLALCDPFPFRPRILRAQNLQHLPWEKDHDQPPRGD
jgi:hypothetical protein